MTVISGVPRVTEVIFVGKSSPTCRATLKCIKSSTLHQSTFLTSITPPSCGMAEGIGSFPDIRGQRHGLVHVSQLKRPQKPPSQQGNENSPISQNRLIGRQISDDYAWTLDRWPLSAVFRVAEVIIVSKSSPTWNLIQPARSSWKVIEYDDTTPSSHMWTQELRTT